MYTRLTQDAYLATEAIFVRLDTRDGLHRESHTAFTRGPFGGINLSDTKEDYKVKPIYLAPIFAVWREQRSYANKHGSIHSVWQPEYSEPCICGSGNSFGACCYRNLQNSTGITFDDFERWLLEEKFELAENYARVQITQYGCWIRQHSTILLDKTTDSYAQTMIAVDCGALEDLFSRLERWASKTNNVDTVTDAYHKMVDTVGVPAIARRLIALNAQWLLTNDRIEHGLLELGVLGDIDQITDSRALMLLVEYSECEPDEERKLCERAVRNALDGDERCVCLYFQATTLAKQNANTEALEAVDKLIELSSHAELHSDLALRGGLTLRWELSESDEDFRRLSDQMKKESDLDGTLSAAVYLHSKNKHDAALEVLAPLLEKKNPLALLLTAEWGIHAGRYEDAYATVSAIGKDEEDDVDVRGGAAYMFAMLALDCGMSHLKDEALMRLTSLTDKEVRFDRQKVIELLKQDEKVKPENTIASAD